MMWLIRLLLSLLFAASFFSVVQAQVTAEWSGRSTGLTYCGAVVCGGWAESRLTVTSGSGYIDIEQRLHEGVSQVSGGALRTSRLWVEEGLHYEIRLDAGQVGVINVDATLPVCYSISFGGEAFSELSLYNFGDFSGLCMATVQMVAILEDGFQVNATDGQYSNIVRVTWNEQYGASGYEVYRCTGETTDSCGTAIATIADHRFNDTGATANTLFHYRVKACSDGICGDFSPDDVGYRTLDDHGNDCAASTNVNGDSSTPGEIEWTIPDDVDYFNIELDATSVLTIYTTGSTDTRGKLYDTNCILSPLQSNSDSGDGANFLISRDLAEGTYWVEVSHQTGGGSGAYEFVSETAPSAELPWDPAYVNASHGTDDQFVHLTWPRAPLSLAGFYNIYRSDSEESVKTFLQKVWAYETEGFGYETSIPGLTPGVEYYFWVIPGNSNGESPMGVWDTGWRAVPVASVPEAPTLNSAEPGHARIELSFIANGDGGSEITGYTANCDGHDASGSASPILVTGLTNGVEYSCTVIATNMVGDSPASNVLQATPVAEPVIFTHGFEDG